MRLESISVSESIGAILIHNIIGADGRKVFSKGHLVSAQDVEKLRALGMPSVYAAMLDAGDVREDDAAARLARAVAGDGIDRSKPSGGRVNLYATNTGFLRVGSQKLKRLNELRGVTLATIPSYSSVAPKKMIATLKTIGLALPEKILREAEQIGAVVSVAPVARQNAAIILTGSASGKARVQELFLPPIRARIEAAGARVVVEDFVAEDEAEIAQAIERAVTRAGVQLIVLAGETSIMDADDITPRGIERAGGEIELYGAPVEPGNLLLLAYRGDTPIIGAPGCIKSRETNVVDLILPRLLIGERVARADVIALAEGGLL
ncbi:MAG: molybdopterin-binding protein [Chloroflexi bacterium]|nr:molybdopterin-binding protein [Chloroflexota bacterium]